MRIVVIQKPDGTKEKLKIDAKSAIDACTIVRKQYPDSKIVSVK